MRTDLRNSAPVLDLGLICPHQTDLRTTYCHECEYARFRRDKRAFEETAVLFPLRPDPASTAPAPAPPTYRWPARLRDLAWGVLGVAVTLAAWAVIVTAVYLLVHGGQ